MSETYEQLTLWPEPTLNRTELLDWLEENEYTQVADNFWAKPKETNQNEH